MLSTWEALGVFRGLGQVQEMGNDTLFRAASSSQLEIFWLLYCLLDRKVSYPEAGGLYPHPQFYVGPLGKVSGTE